MKSWFWKTWTVRSPEGVIIAVRLPRSWKRTHDAVAPLAFQNERDQSLFQITPFPREVSARMRGKLRELVSARAKDIGGKSIGDRVELFGLGGDKAEGWYFIAADRNVAPGEWAHIICGMIEIDRQVMMFTILSHQPLRMGEGDALRAFEYVRVANV